MTDEEIIEKTYWVLSKTIYEAFDRVNTNNFNKAYEIAFEIVVKEHLKEALSLSREQKDNFNEQDAKDILDAYKRGLEAGAKQNKTKILKFIDKGCNERYFLTSERTLICNSEKMCPSCWRIRQKIMAMKNHSQDSSGVGLRQEGATPSPDAQNHALNGEENIKKTGGKNERNKN